MFFVLNKKKINSYLLIGFERMRKIVFPSISLNKSWLPTNKTPINQKISINKATKEELMNLSGIGESKAIDIINYRNENGLFKSIEELKQVNGIGDKLFEKIKDQITI